MQRERLRDEGYARLPRATRDSEATELARAVATLVRHGWHPLWCVVFDEAWLWLALAEGKAVSGRRSSAAQPWRISTAT